MGGGAPAEAHCLPAPACLRRRAGRHGMRLGEGLEPRQPLTSSAPSRARRFLVAVSVRAASRPEPAPSRRRVNGPDPAAEPVQNCGIVLSYCRGCGGRNVLCTSCCYCVVYIWQRMSQVCVVVFRERFCIYFSLVVFVLFSGAVGATKVIL